METILRKNSGIRNEIWVKNKENENKNNGNRSSFHKILKLDKSTEKWNSKKIILII